MNIDKYDIVIVDEKPLQYLGKEMDNGAIVQDIHTKEKLIHINLISRKANKDETKWFCERTEHINFIAPSSNVLQHRNKLTKTKMNGKRLFREWAQSKGKEAKEFVTIKDDWYDADTLITKDIEGKIEETTIRYKDMVHWIIKNLNQNKEDE